MRASPSGVRAAVTTSGTRTPTWVAINVASASCSTCSRRPTATLLGGSRYASERHRRAMRWVSCASRPRTRTLSGRPRGSCPTYSAAPMCCRTAAVRSATSTPSDSRASRIVPTGGEPAAVPNASRTRLRPRDQATGRPGIPTRGPPPSATAPSAAKTTSHPARMRTGGRARELRPRRQRQHTRRAARGTPPRPEVRLDHEPVRLHQATEDEPPTTRSSATSKSRARAQRRRTRTSTTITRARTGAATNDLLPGVSAHPRTVTSAWAVSSSTAAAEAATTAARPARSAPTTRTTASIVRRWRRPGSAAVRSARFQDHLASAKATPVAAIVDQRRSEGGSAGPIRAWTSRH